MSFLYPAFLIGALAVAIPVVLHLLRRDVAPEVPFTAVRLLRRAPIEQTRRRRLRDLLLLAARVTALSLLAAAFARPYFASPAVESRLLLVAVDRSYSMSAPGRFERALALAREALDAAGRGDRVALIAFDDRADVVAGPGPAGDARAAIGDLRAGYGGTRYAPLVARAVELSQDAPARLVVISDLQRAGWENEEPFDVPASLGIETRDVGVPAGNVAVLAIRREPGSVIARIRNEGAQDAAGTGRVIVDGRTAASAAFRVPAATASDLTIAYRAPEQGGLMVEIDDPGGFAPDNRRYLVLDPTPRPRVLLVAADAEESGFYLTRALEAAGGEGAFDVRRRPAPSLAAMPPKDLAGYGAVVFLSSRNVDRRGRDLLDGYLRGGGGLIVAASPDVEAAWLAGLVAPSRFSAAEIPGGPGTLAATDLRHPVFRPFGPLAANLAQVRFSRAWSVRAEGWDVAARFTDGAPALLERRVGQGRLLLFTSDLDRRWNDFPLHPGFVPFAIEAVRHVTAGADARRDYAVAQPPPGIPGEPGLYSLPRDGRRISVNVDSRESATARLTSEEFKRMTPPVDRPPPSAAIRHAQQLEAQQSLWRYGVLLMLGALVAESVVGRST
jgi:hypothetical protein